jgi:hypothetical protein
MAPNPEPIITNYNQPRDRGILELEPMSRGTITINDQRLLESIQRNY